MFDDFRDPTDAPPTSDPDSAMSANRGRSPGLLGMTALQRLIIALLLFLAVCILGTMCLLATQRIGAF
jgi:hypothetical protein